jgi:surface antigen
MPRTFLHLRPGLCALLLVALLAGCGSPSPKTGPNLAASSHHSGLTCAPFARELSGIALYGDAATWWNGASGRYDRANRPSVGSVLVFQRSSRLASGHVSVVSRVLSPRQIHVIQANWVPDELDEDQLIIDVSERNDWTQVRVWYPPINQMGSGVYATYGFVLPPRPATHDELARAIPAAVRFATENSGRSAPRARLAGG